MLSVERLKEIINDPNLSDEKLKEIRDAFYLLADIILNHYQSEKDKTNTIEKNTKKV
jgi:signal-transduction protein with cAMP-binding, CBS, and nucleotidyltransferase domain